MGKLGCSHKWQTDSSGILAFQDLEVESRISDQNLGETRDSGRNQTGSGAATPIEDDRPNMQIYMHMMRYTSLYDYTDYN